MKGRLRQRVLDIAAYMAVGVAVLAVIIGLIAFNAKAPCWLWNASPAKDTPSRCFR